MIYFDHNATSPLHPAARAAWIEASETLIGNPSSLHRLGSRAESAMEKARLQVAEALGCPAADIVWTSGASEANTTVFHHLAQATAERSGEVWVSAIEHPSVLASARHFFGQAVRLIPVTSGGTVDLNWLENALRRSLPLLISIMAANNETGALQPWREASSLCREFEVPFFCDAVQWMGKLPAAGLGVCDFVAASAHKFGGPKGIGFLKVPSLGALRPLIHGGQQEHGRRAGTENVPGILALAAALAARETALRDGRHRMRAGWKEEFERNLAAKLPHVRITGQSVPRLWNTASVVMPDVQCRFRWVVKLDKAGFAASTGSACASGEEKPSHVLTAMQFTAAEISQTVRFSAGWETTEEDWRQLSHTIEKIGAS